MLTQGAPLAYLSTFTLMKWPAHTAVTFILQLDSFLAALPCSLWLQSCSLSALPSKALAAEAWRDRNSTALGRQNTFCTGFR